MTARKAFPASAEDDARFMALALEAARAAEAEGEAPIGAVLVDAAGKVIASGRNNPIAAHDPTAHAEIAAIRAGARQLGNYRLSPGLTLYVTLEPCAMCAGAIANARIARLVYGAADKKGGAVESGVRFFESPTCHWRPLVASRVLAEESAAMLKAFFKARR